MLTQSNNFLLNHRNRNEKNRNTNPTLALRKHLANFRHQYHVENVALFESEDRKTLKDSIGWTLKPEQLRYLRSTTYEYNASAGSILELLVMQKFWTWLARFIPKSIAPSTITAIGFVINIVTSTIIIHYSPDCRSIVPTWSLVVCALGVWLYQIADALDGKQSYKVQNTQLEEFYDHSCDSISTILLMYSAGVAVQAGQWPSLFLVILFTSLIDVTEAQWTMIAVHLVSAIFGQSIWSQTLSLTPTLALELRTIFLILTLLSLLNSILSNAAIVLLGIRTPLERLGAPIKRRYDGISFKTIKPILPALFLSILIYYSYQQGYYHLNPTMFILAFGFNFAKLTMKLVIAHCTYHEIELLDLTLVAPILLSLNDLLSIDDPIISHNQALLGALIWDTIEVIRYFTFVSWDLCIALDINIFSIKFPIGHPKNRCQTGGFYINGLNNKEILSKSSQDHR
ncbi:Choline/ethanolaminephosphotransferase 1 [Sarcoptes scabiei]|uniref:Choline/ethanolaminephosphotransferase 1 n=1 Tax=Sarcoptes scabiei TaxID=52283 RepID=A0A834R9Y0_SARSC|nr:Choline/ethanolaminephosphotransferase 1 [Sarcoptes scabiei]